MKRLLSVFALALSVACGSNSPTGPSAAPSPSPSPSPTPVPPTVAISVAIDAYASDSRLLIFSAAHGEEFVIKASVTAFNLETQETVPAPFIYEHEWQNFSDPFVGCVISGPVTTDHPHVRCMGDGYFIVRDTAFTYANVVVGRSPLYSMPIGTAAASGNTWRRLDDAEAASVLARFGIRD